MTALLPECGHEVITGTGTLAEPVIVLTCTLTAGHAGRGHHDRDVDGVSPSWTCPESCDGGWGHAHRLDGAP